MAQVVVIQHAGVVGACTEDGYAMLDASISIREKTSWLVEMLIVVFQIMKEYRQKNDDQLKRMTEQLSANFEADVGKLNKSIEKMIETEVSKLNFMITSIGEENDMVLRMLILK